MKSYQDIAADGGSDVVGQVLEQRKRLRDRLSTVERTVAVASGKGGVGKSFVTATVASSLAAAGLRVGILDADLNGSSIPGMAGLSGGALRPSGTGMIPPATGQSVRVMSIDLFREDDRAPVLWEAPTQQDAYAWRTMIEMSAVREFLSDTEWGELDYLLIDLPPGTDRLSNLADLLPDLSGLLLVTIPSGVSERVVAKTIRLAKQFPQIPLLGLVENMASHLCPHCGREDVLYPGGRIERLAEDEGVPYLGRIPFDPTLARSADEGTLLTNRIGEFPAGAAAARLAGRIRAHFAGGAS